MYFAGSVCSTLLSLEKPWNIKTESYNWKNVKESTFTFEDVFNSLIAQSSRFWKFIKFFGTSRFSLSLLLEIQIGIYYNLLTIYPQFSNWGLIVNFEIWHGSLFKGRMLIKKVCTLHVGLFETACFLHAMIISG